MAKRDRNIRKPKKKKSASTKPAEPQRPADLWGASQWRTIKFVSAILSFGILLTMFQSYAGLGDAISMSNVLPGFLIDVVLFVVGIFFLMSPFSPLRIYGQAKHRWLFGWVFFMALIAHLITNIAGLIMVFGAG